jgi:hypothetical protein
MKDAVKPPPLLLKRSWKNVGVKELRIFIRDHSGTEAKRQENVEAPKNVKRKGTSPKTVK